MMGGYIYEDKPPCFDGNDGIFKQLEIIRKAALTLSKEGHKIERIVFDGINEPTIKVSSSIGMLPNETRHKDGKKILVVCRLGCQVGWEQE